MGPELTECKWKVAHLVWQDTSSFELSLEQNESLVDPSTLTLVPDLTIVVQSVCQNIHTFLYCLWVCVMMYDLPSAPNIKGHWPKY